MHAATRSVSGTNARAELSQTAKPKRKRRRAFALLFRSGWLPSSPSRRPLAVANHETSPLATHIVGPDAAGIGGMMCSEDRSVKSFAGMLLARARGT